MQLANSKLDYGALPQALHWLTAICVVAGWLLGQFGDAFPKGRRARPRYRRISRSASASWCF
jgi:cytochrome b561